MIEDFREIVSERREWDFDVCIAGAGAAGITLAKALAGSKLKVAVFEGGGLDSPTSAERELYRGSAGPRPYPLEISRLRWFGGTTNHWGGWCRPLDAIDFAKRDYVAFSGWPLSRDDLADFYEQAHRVCQIENINYDPDSALRNSPDATLKMPPGSGFVNKLFRFSPPTRFGDVYRDLMRESENISVFLHANVTNIASENSRVSHLDVSTLNGGKIEARAKYFVVALGGLETPRLLLNSTDTYPSGIGNHSDFVGRCFMDHFGFRPGFSLARSDLKYFRFASGPFPLMPVLSMDYGALQEHHLRNFCILLHPESMSSVYPPQALANPGFSPINGNEEKSVRYLMQFINEPTPNLDSRVSLSNRTDALGMRRLHLDWRINQEDLDNVDKVMERLIKMLGISRMGRVQYDQMLDEEAAKTLSVSMHHMGTTRMSVAKRTGVVDHNCRVHGTENLYIAGSSVFPCVGFSNPTLTIVALTLRLAEHLRRNSN